MPTQEWDADVYSANVSFVTSYGERVLDLLAAQPGERVLDLGCGEGAHAAQLLELGVDVVGVDASAAMVDAARARGVDARVVDGRALSFDADFDAVFSNAALHWMDDLPAVLAGVRRALKPGGRFVGEFAGHGNIAAIGVAASAVLRRRDLPVRNPWFMPTVDRWQAMLEDAGLVVDLVRSYPRPTPLPTGLAGWLEVFGATLLPGLTAADRTAAYAEVCELARPWLCDDQGRWTADYVRQQFRAERPAHR